MGTAHVFDEKNTIKTASCERMIIGMNDGSVIWLRGLFGVRVYAGQVELGGCRLEPLASNQYSRCAAPKYSSAMELHAVENKDVKRKRLILVDEEEIEAEGLARQLAQHFPVVVVLKALLIDYTNVDCFVSSPLGFQFILDTEEETTIPKALDGWIARGGTPRRIASKPWAPVINAIVQQNRTPTTVVCGPKGAGKSTFARYLVNATLPHTSVVAYLDTDVGQPEFTPSGMVSLHLLTQPILGPAHTHMKIMSLR